MPLMSKLEGQVAFITGAARGQGRDHAVRLAQDGADIIAVDLCQQMHSVVYPMSTREDLDETVRLVKDLGRRVFAAEADVRDYVALQQAFDEGFAEPGAVTIVIAKAACGPGPLHTPAHTLAEVRPLSLPGLQNTGEHGTPDLVAQTP